MYHFHFISHRKWASRQWHVNIAAVHLGVLIYIEKFLWSTVEFYVFTISWILKKTINLILLSAIVIIRWRIYFKIPASSGWVMESNFSFFYFLFVSLIPNKNMQLIFCIWKAPNTLITPTIEQLGRKKNKM